MEWWNTVIWSWRNMEITNGKLVFIIPLLVLLLFCTIAIIKCLFVFHNTQELTIYYGYIGALDKAFRDGKLDELSWQILRISLNDVLIPMSIWIWCPWKWTTKQMFRKGMYQGILDLTTILQDL